MNSIGRLYRSLGHSSQQSVWDNGALGTGAVSANVKRY